MGFASLYPSYKIITLTFVIASNKREAFVQVSVSDEAIHLTASG